MFRTVAVSTLACALVAAGPLSAQTRKGAAKSVLHNITVTADTVYTGTMELAVEGDKVTGNLKITSPTEITGKVAGTAKEGTLLLDFPYHMTEQNCTGNVTMNIKLAAKAGPSTGIMEATSCGGQSADRVTGTVELTPPAEKEKK